MYIFDSCEGADTTFFNLIYSYLPYLETSSQCCHIHIFGTFQIFQIKFILLNICTYYTFHVQKGHLSKKRDVNLDIRTKEKKNVERDCTKETY